MKEAFEKIKERLEEQKKIMFGAYETSTWTPNKIGFHSSASAYADAIEIVNQVAEEYGKDGWIPCSSGNLPNSNGWYECWYMVSCVCNKKEYEPKTLYWEDHLWLYRPNSFSMPTKEYVVAWKPIAPYQPKGE